MRHRRFPALASSAIFAALAIGMGTKTFAQTGSGAVRGARWGDRNGRAGCQRRCEHRREPGFGQASETAPYHSRKMANRIRTKEPSLDGCARCRLSQQRGRDRLRCRLLAASRSGRPRDDEGRAAGCCCCCGSDGASSARADDSAGLPPSTTKRRSNRRLPCQRTKTRPLRQVLSARRYFVTTLSTSA